MEFFGVLKTKTGNASLAQAITAGGAFIAVLVLYLTGDTTLLAKMGLDEGTAITAMIGSAALMFQGLSGLFQRRATQKQTLESLLDGATDEDKALATALLQRKAGLREDQ